MRQSRSVRLIVPALLGPVTDAAAVARLQPRLPALERLLARARTGGGEEAGGEAAVCTAFGVDGPPWPVAAAARAGEADAVPGGGSPDGWWLRVDPVHLRVDTDHARLFGPYVLGLEATEAAALVERLNGHLEADGLAIEAPAPDRWYLRLAEAPDLRTHDLPEVAGRNVNPFLPGGGAAARWRGWLTEIQMLLHDAPVNIERERRGRLPVNSVWPWGGGFRPAVGAGPSAVRAGDALTRGLARLAGTPVIDPAEGEGSWPPGETVVVDFGVREPLVHGEIEGWLEALAALDRGWLARLLADLRGRRLDRLEIDPCDGRRLRIGRAGLGRIWRRERPWHTRLGAE